MTTATMATATVLAEGLTFGEGPRWHAGRLWFSDFYDHAVKSMDAAGAVRTEIEIDDQPSGLGWLPDGRLLVVAMKRRQLLRVDPEGIKVHADLSPVAAYHAIDMVVDRFGRAYVGNFGFALDAALASRSVAEVFADHATARLARVDPDGRYAPFGRAHRTLLPPNSFRQPPDPCGHRGGSGRGKGLCPSPRLYLPR